MDMLIGCRLAAVTRLAWRRPGDPVDLTTGPVHLAVDDGRGLLFDARSDWSLKIVPTAPGDESWRSAYDYDFDGGRWARRDASGEEPFASVIAGVLSGWDPERDEAGHLAWSGWTGSTLATPATHLVWRVHSSHGQRHGPGGSGPQPASRG